MRVQIGLLFCMTVFISSVYCAGITPEMIEKSTGMVKSVCQPKWKVTEEDIDKIRKGQFPDFKPLKCYAHCIFEMMGMMKKSKVQLEGALKQFDLLLPDDYKEPYKNSLIKCKDEGKGNKDACEVAYAILQCFYKNNDKFVFP